MNDTAIVDVLERAVADGTTPAAAALVKTASKRFVHVAGNARIDTVFDLASLTKLLSTTSLVARALDAGKLTLDETPWPRWPAATIEHVMRHEAGLPPWRPFFELARGVAGMPAGKRIVVDAVLATALEVAPGSRTLYSDLGFIALGALLEERLGRGLDELFAEVAGDSGVRFVRLDRDGFHPALPNVAPTERCPWRRRVVQGQVHDENCFAIGGVSGHAGLFGSIVDVERAVASLLPLLARFRDEPGRPRARRPIGFDTATPGGSTGDALSPRAVGHLGFTGTSIWLDDDVTYVLLTNRVHETRAHPERILAARQAFHRAAAAWARS